MAGTNVPSPTFSSSGFVVPSTQAVLAGVVADIQAAFGNTLNLSATDSESLTTPQGQLATSWAAIINNVYALFQLYTQLVDPAYSFGRMQDAIGRLYDLERDGAEPTSLQVSCLGLSGIVLPVGATVQDPSGNVYSLLTAVTIPPSGSVTGSFACTVPGPVAVPETVTIYQSVTGWDSATVVSGVEGVDTETRQAFEARREDALESNSVGSVNAIIGAVAQVPGVLDYYGYNNNTSGSVVIGGVSIAAYAVYVCVAGGAPSAVAQAILSKKGPGAPMTGNTVVTAYDENPLYAAPVPYAVAYEIPTPLQFLFSVTLVAGPNIPSDSAQQIQTALINAFTQGVLPNSSQNTPGLKARIGQVVYALTYLQVINALGSWAQVAAIEVGSANSPGAVFVGTISGTALTVSSVTSGTIAVGQALFDTTGAIALGTVITGGSGTSWTVNNSQTVAGGSFTGTASAIGLVATSVTGSIAIGQGVSGTGIPAGTTIIAQVSGTPGGAGTYLTSAATSASSTACTTAGGATFTGTASNLGLVVTSPSGGEILAGQLISGSGVTAGTTITQQLSGTAGGAGTYVTSQANTASSATLTTSETISAATASGSSVSVQANQVPQLNAANIAVGVT